MAVCFQCSQEKSRDAFSKAQLRKTGATRRCKQCIEADDLVEEARKTNKLLGKHNAKVTKNLGRTSSYQPPPPPPPPSPLSDTKKTAVQRAITVAVKCIMKRGIPSGVGLDGFNSQELESRLWEVSNNEYLYEWLIVPLLNGLVYGNPKINDKSHFIRGQEPHPIIMWLCQHRNLRAQFNYCGRDDMVALVLSAGADVSLRVSNGCNPLFFAVKYGSARTIELLLDAGVKVDERDVFGRTIWKNALERPDLRIIKLLIDRCSDLIPVHREVIPIGIEGEKGAIDYTLPDNMLSMFVGFFSNSNISWLLLGAPSADEMATALVRVLQAGARFSQANAMAFSKSTVSNPLAFVTHVDTPGSEYYTEEYTEPQLDTARSLRDVIYGRWLPVEIMKEVQSVNQSCSPDNTCPICLTDMEPSDNPVTLYCGHKFCLECIKAYGKAKLDGDLTHRFSSVELDEVGQVRSATVQAKGTDKRCPICRRLLCGDLLDEDYNKIYRSLVGFRFGIDRHEAGGELTGGTKRGPHLLSDEQLRFECKVIIGKTEGTREALLKELLRSMRESSQTSICTDDNSNMEDVKVELSAGATILSGDTGKIHGFYAPKWGPVLVPITVKGVPILASLSPNSVFTVVPKAVVKSFGLKTKPIASSKFVTVTSGIVDVAEVVDELRFFLEDVEICLNNAIVLKTEPSIMRSVQLGMDFFETSLWNRYSVRLTDDMYAVCDGGHTADMFMKDQPDELRYYSRDGKICQVPFIYVNKMGCETSMPVVSLPGDFSAKCGECQWCCRYFPCDGMLKLKNDDDENNGSARSFCYYCDEECKAKGMAIRN